MNRPRTLLFLSVALLLSIAAGAAPRQDTQAVPALEASKFIDTQTEAKWKEHGLKPAPHANDEEFLRRVYLDIAGTIPSVDQAKAFLDDAAADKRAKLIDRLLDSSDYGDHWSEVWLKVLGTDEPKNQFAIYAETFRQWMAEQFNKNVPWDKLAASMLTATGRNDENPATYYLLQYIVTNRKEAPEALGSATANQFLGISIACAHCHNHPFAHWKQSDFYSWAAFFKRTELKIVQKPEKGQLPIVELSERRTGELTIPKGKGDDDDKGMMDMPKPGDEDKPTKKHDVKAGDIARPIFLGASEPVADTNRREAFVKLLTAPENLQFAKAVVNRYWTSLFGRGIVHPADGFDDKNQPSMPDLLDALSRDFIKNGYDVKWLVRAIVNSKTYQRSSRTGDLKTVDDLYFSHARLRPMQPHQIMNVLMTAFDAEELMKMLGGRKGKGKGKKGNGDGKDELRLPQDKPKGDKQDPPRPEMPKGMDMQDMARRRAIKGLEEVFNVDPDDLSSFKISMQQALTMMNSDKVQQLMRPTVMKLMRDLRTPEERIDYLFLAFLSRRPSKEELSGLKRYVENDHRGETYEDVAWTLLNTSEFFFVH